MSNAPDKSCREKTYILCSITFFQNHAICDIKWKNMVETDWPQITIQYVARTLHAG